MDETSSKLLSLFDSLSSQDRATLLAFAEFLKQRVDSTLLQGLQATTPEKSEPEPIPEPVPIARPEEERVVAAIKRLSESYPMLNKNDMLGETSDLLTQHVLQGREAAEVIDDLEVVFQSRYQAMVDAREADD